MKLFATNGEHQYSEGECSTPVPFTHSPSLVLPEIHPSFPPPLCLAQEIKFLCVARRSDKVILASHTHTSDKTYDYIEKVKQVMSSPGWATVTSSKLSLEDGGYLFFVLIDEVRAGERLCHGTALSLGSAPAWPPLLLPALALHP